VTDANCDLGRTDVTVREIRASIDIERAGEQLDYWNVDVPRAKVEAFVESLPELLEWLENNGREYPWRNVRDPWNIYTTEILLQRTRADAVEAVYDDFFAKFPGPEALDNASRDEIYETVHSLGFGDQRTRTLAEVSEYLTVEHSGEVPCSIEALQEPWRTGPYAARATVQFAFGQPVAIVDSNFARILARVFNIDLPEQPHKSDAVYELLEALVPSEPSMARAFNLALLDLGALVCTPQNPDCSVCPLLSGCKYGRSRMGSGE